MAAEIMSAVGSAHFSSLSTRFFVMQLAMMIAELTPRSLSERLIDSGGFAPLPFPFVPFKSAIGSA